MYIHPAHDSEERTSRLVTGPALRRRRHEKRLGENLFSGATSPRAQNRFQAVRESNDFGVFLKSRRGDSATDDRAALTSTCEEDTVKTHGFFFSLLFSLFVRDASAPPLPRGLPPPRHGLQASLGSIERDENLTGTRSLFFAPRADRARTPRRASPALHASTRRTSKIRFLPRGS